MPVPHIAREETIMRNIVLFCAAGMSTSLLVTKMQKAADAAGYEATIAAHPIAEADTYGKDADIVLLGPQVRFELARIQGLLSDKKVEAIDMMAYGMMNGEAVIAQVKKALGD